MIGRDCFLELIQVEVSGTHIVVGGSVAWVVADEFFECDNRFAWTGVLKQEPAIILQQLMSLGKWPIASWKNSLASATLPSSTAALARSANAIGTSQLLRFGLFRMFATSALTSSSLRCFRRISPRPRSLACKTETILGSNATRVQRGGGHRYPRKPELSCAGPCRLRAPDRHW